MIKKFVISCGRGLIDGSALLCVIAIVIAGIVTLLENVAVGLAILVGGTMSFVVFYYMVYLLISINDNLTEINNKLGNKKEE